VCEGSSKNTDPPFEKFYEYFTKNNAVSKATALAISIGSGVLLKAFLLGFNFQVADAQTSLGQFTMTLAIVPKKPQ
jgi:Zn finger protein HypA/HybF involved in hydrogenase expression